MPADLVEVEGERVGEQHEREAERRHRPQHWRREVEVDEGEPIGTQDRAQTQQHGHLGKAAPFDQPREQGRDDDDGPHEGQGGEEGIRGEAHGA